MCMVVSFITEGRGLLTTLLQKIIFQYQYNPLILDQLHIQCCTKIYIYMYRLYTEVKVSMGFIIPSDEVARLINAIETVPRYITDFSVP